MLLASRLLGHSARLCLRSPARIVPYAVPILRHKLQQPGRTGMSSSAAAIEAPMDSISYLSQTEAIAVDEELMGPLGFSVDQLMELAGYSVATSLASEYPSERFKRVLVIAGPGNNGGDGLVAARHLHHFGYQVQIVYPKPTDKPLYKGVVTQAHALQMPLLSWVDVQAAGPLAQQYDVVLDAIFGFSFKGDPRPPFDQILKVCQQLIAVAVLNGCTVSWSFAAEQVLYTRTLSHMQKFVF
ncbi:YjeF N-terminal domain-containing protein, partial [Dunaliella salina]